MNNKLRSLTVGSVVGTLVLLVRLVSAQCTFTSGSTGSDGTLYLSPSATNAPAGTIFTNTMLNGQGYHLAEVPLPRKGIFNFTRVYIETNWAVSFIPNAANTPVWILATTDVVVRGSIMVTGSPPVGVEGGFGGPGGYQGGNDAISTLAGTGGLGPGGTSNACAGFAAPGSSFNSGGQPDPVYGGPQYGTLDLQPLIGGSGGGAYFWHEWSCDSPGSGGGGAILIASSSLVNITGEVNADGGSTWCSYFGSGGAIRLVAPTIQGEGTIHAMASGGASVGRIRLEGCTINRITMCTPPATFGPAASVFLASPPSIQITSIAGQTAPSSPTGSLANVDMFLPSGFVNPATISVTASNVPGSTGFTIVVVPANGTNFSASGTLALYGSSSVSTGSVTMNVYTDQIWRANAVINSIPRP